MPYQHDTKEERDALGVMLGMQLPKTYISVILGKHLSSIYHELNRNSDENGIYIGREAQYEADQRRANTKERPKMSDDDLMAEVLALFKQDYSPDRIAGYLRLKYPHNPERWVSHETIYQYIYQRIASDPALKRHFRHARTYRKGRGGAKDRRGQIPDRNTKENPPAIVEEKTRVGDWEGDTVESAGKNTYIATFVDKTSKLLVAKVMPNKAAVTLNSAAIRTFRVIPDDFIKTITFDNGKEFSGHKALVLVLECDIYFAHPYHSWERGLNEHPNGLIRQYLRKKTSFEGLTQRQLDKIVMKINNRPHKALGYRMPHEVFAECKFALQI